MGGYNKIIEKLIDGIDIQLDSDFFKNRIFFESLAENIVFTGKIDEYFDYEYGKLEYRSLKFTNEVVNTDNYQGNAVVNYNDANVPFTRIIEHKHFEFGKQPKTVITKEYPENWDVEKEAFYPINDDKNQKIYNLYKQKAEQTNVLFGGRLAEYKYYDMHQIIASALTKFKKQYETE